MSKYNPSPDTGQVTPILYKIVFTSKIASLAALLLLCTILLQPLHRAYADEVPEPVPEDVLLSGEILPAEDIIPLEFDAIESDSVTIPEDSDESLESLLPSQSVGDVEESVDDVSVLLVNESNDSDGEGSEITSPDGTGEGESTASEAELTDGDELLDVTDNSSNNSLTDPVASSSILTDSVTASSTDSVATTSDVAMPAVFTVESDTHMSFNKSDCTVVSDGSYYCQPASVTLEQERADGLYALADGDGDLEIFLQRDGVLEQITFNTVDDASPYYDEQSNTMVWHRSVDDRFQIFSRNIETGVESQLTRGEVNNMEPHRSGDYTVWQHWDGNWEIVFNNGDESFNISNADAHDISPSIRNGLIIWQRITTEGQRTLELYTIETGERTTINDTDGGAITNPRMVVVYESMQANGDVITKGYDLVTGEIIALASAAPELPETIPDPDETGETRALLQAKPGAREDTTEVLDDMPVATGGTTPLMDGDLVIGETATSSQVVGALIATSTMTVFDDATLTLDLRTDTATATKAAFTLEIPTFVNTISTTSTDVVD